MDTPEDIAQRKREEEALYAASQQLKLLLESTSVVIYTARTSGNYGPTSITENVREMLGYEPEELTADSNFWIDHVHPEDRQHILGELPHLEGGACVYEYRFQHRDGTYRWMRDEMRLMTDALGNPVQIVGYWIDITERKRAEEALRLSQDMFQKAFQASPDIMVVHTLSEGRHVDVNQAFLRLFGYRREEVIGQTAVELGLWMDLAQRSEYLRILREQGRVRDLEICVRTKSGEACTLLMSAEVIKVAGQGCVVAIGKDITDRKQAEEALRASEQRYRLLFERNLAGVFRTTVDGRILDCNEAFARLFGYSSREEMLSRPAWELYHDPADREAFLANLKNQRELTNREYCLRRKDGTSVWVLENSTLLEGEDDAPAVIEGTSIDITERKRAEERFSKAFNASPEPITISTLSDGTYVDVNESFLRITGYERDEIVGRSTLDMKFWLEPKARTRLLEALEQGPVRDFEMRFITKSGEIRSGQLSADVIEVGGQRCLLAVTKDITERKQAEAALIEERHLLSTLMDNLPDWIYFKDRHSRFIRANKALSRAFGLTDPAQAVGKTDFDFFTEEHARPAYTDEQEIIRTGQPMLAKEEKETWPDGHETWVSTTKMPLRDASGNIIGTFGVSRDVTERRCAEEALRDSEEKYRLLFSQAPDAIHIVDLETHELLDANEAASKLHGYAHDEFLRLKAEDISAEPERTAVVLQEAQTGFVHVPMRWHHKKDGTVFPVEITGGPFLWKGRRVICVFIRDITERKRAERELHESEERYRGLVEAAPDVIYTLSAEDGSITSLNPAFERFTGWPRAEWLGKPFVGIVHPDDLPVALETFQKASRGETQPPYQLRILSKSGEYLVGEFTSTPHVRGGKIVGELGIARDITERKRTEEALQVSELQLAEAMDMARLAHWEFDMASGMFIFNDRFYSLYGTTAEREGGYQMSAETYAREFLFPEDAHLVVDAAAMSRTTTDPNALYTLEHRIRRRDGELRHIVVRVSVIKDSEGRTIKVRGVNQDITERKLAEQALLLSEEKFAKAFRSSPNAMAISTLEEGRFLEVNDSFLRLSGRQREDIVGRTGLELGVWVNPEDRVRVSDELRKSGRVNGREILFRSPSGQITVVLFSAEPIEVRGVHCLLSVVQDITERKQAEEALRLSQEMFQKAFHASPDTMVLHTLSEGRHIDVNEAFLRLIGYRREELVGRTAMDLGSWWDLAQRDEYLRILREQGRVRDLEICVPTKSGEARTLLLSAEVIEIAGQDCVVAIGKDISEQKKAEQERMYLEEQLRQAQKMEAVGRLAGGVAHDFNNILMVINGYTQLVLRKLSPRHPIRQHLNEIRKAGERAASLTRQLLAFSRRQVLVPEILDLNKVVADTKEMLRRVIGEDVELVFRQGHKLAKVLTDPGQMAQVLVNLAVNAREAMPGGGRLTIETGNVDLREAEIGDLPGAAPGPHVMLAVSDTGVGMSKEVMEHMFEPFFTTREQGKGIGLGLSTVYGIVKQSGGCVRAQSEPGHSSTFRVYLPCARVGSGKPVARSAKARLAKGRETVLVVEDELAVRQVVAATLRSSGYKVLEAGSGEQAMRCLRRHEGPLHLVLTDLVMPRMNGRQVADSVRTLYPEVKIVFMSGYSDDALLRHGVADAQGSFLPKPFTIEALTQKVREVLKPSR
jgi:two-component system cell cycle sensor histidine kinase/response regulator CckA